MVSIPGTYVKMQFFLSLPFNRLKNGVSWNIGEAFSALLHLKTHPGIFPLHRDGVHGPSHQNRTLSGSKKSRLFTARRCFGPSEEQRVLAVTQSLTFRANYSEVLRKKKSFVCARKARIAHFPFIISLSLSPPNIPLNHLLSFCPFLRHLVPHSHSHPIFFSFLPHPTHTQTHAPSLPPSLPTPDLSLCFPSLDWGSVLLV